MPRTGKDRPFASLAAELGYSLRQASEAHPGRSERPAPQPAVSPQGNVIQAPTVLAGDPEVQSVDIRLFFPADVDKEAILNELNKILQLDTADEIFEVWHSLISAYEIINDGFGNLTADSKPLA